MKKICQEDFLSAEKIRMRCPFCGEWQELLKIDECGYDYAEEYYATHALTCKKRLYYDEDTSDLDEKGFHPKLTLNAESDLITIEMDNPCCFLKDRTKCIELEYSEFKVKKEKNLEKACIKEIVENDMKDDIRSNLIWSDENVDEKVKKGCQSQELEGCKECFYAQADYKKKDVYAMQIPIEIEFIIKGEEDVKEEVVEKSKKAVKEKNKVKGEKSMKMLAMNDINNLSKDLGINFGVNTDERIQSTILGTVVEYTEGKFRGFDRETKQMTEYNNLATILLPSILVPSTTVKEGDTIIHSGEPLFIVKAEEDNVWGANPITSKEEKVLPIANPLGIKTYTRLISVGEIMGFKGNNPKNTKIVMWILTMLANKVFSEGIDSANDKIREVTAKGEKYLEVLVPFACVAFAAYAMKGDDMKSSNIIQTAKDTLGVDLDCLKDKKNLKRIAAIGVATTAAITYFNGKMKKIASDEYDEDEVTNGLDKLIKAVKPWENTIKKVLPAAIAICAVSIFNDKKIENIKEQLEGCVLLVQDKFCEKFGIEEDVFNEENLKKFIALIGIAIAIFMAYGKKLDSNDKNAEEANGMIKQIIPVIVPLIPAIIVFAPKMKTFFKKYGFEDIKEEDCEEFWDDVDDNNDFAEVDAEEIKESEKVEDSVKSETPENLN